MSDTAEPVAPLEVHEVDGRPTVTGRVKITRAATGELEEHDVDVVLTDDQLRDLENGAPLHLTIVHVDAAQITTEE